MPPPARPLPSAAAACLHDHKEAVLKRAARMYGAHQRWVPLLDFFHDLERGRKAGVRSDIGQAECLGVCGELEAPRFLRSGQSRTRRHEPDTFPPTG